LVSRLTQEKNVEFLFESVVKVLKNNEKSKFLVAGEGYSLPKLKKIVLDNKLEKRIIFAGIIHKEELKNYYAAGDIFVYSSKSETQGMIISEAMYCGLPIVAVDAPGVCDLVKDEINGFLVPESKDDFVMAIERLAVDGNLRRKFSEESKRIARENFTDKVCAEKMLKVYKSLIS
jgi:1,2-diacylglycerol 3-alpha-glucosyltransferase